MRILILVAMTIATASGLYGHWFLGDDYRLIDVTPEYGWNLRKHIVESIEYPLHWSPFGGLVWWIEMNLFGPSPFPYHLVNCVVHLGTALILGKISDHFNPPVVGTFAAAMFYGLFAHYEITASISSSNYGGLACLFMTAGAWFYLRDWSVLSAIAFLFALGSKEDGVAFLPIIFGHAVLARNFTRRRLGYLVVIVLITGAYFALSKARLSDNYFTEHGVVDLAPGMHWFENILLYAGILPASLLLPVKTLPWIPLKFLGAVFIIVALILFRRMNTATRWGLFWMLGGITPFLTVLIPWQSRYTVTAAAGFCLMTCAIARFPRARWALAILIVMTFICRLIAQDKFYAVKSAFYAGEDPAAIAREHF